MKMLAATMPTIPAAIHSIASIKRSIEARMSAPHGLGIARGTRRQEDPAAAVLNKLLLRQGVVLAESRAKFRYRGVRIGPGFLDALGPGLDQRLGGFLANRRLFGAPFLDFVYFFRLPLFNA